MPEPIRARRLKPKPSSGFVIHEPKQIAEETARRFWEEYDAGLRTGKIMMPPWKRRVVRFSASQAATVREFASAEEFEYGLRMAIKLPKRIMEMKPESFELQPVEILSIDRAKLRYAEKVYPAPTIQDILFGAGLKDRSRYLPFFEKKMARKGVNPQQVRSAIWNAWRELTRIQVHPDMATSNFLVLDIDKSTGKALLAIVDYTDSKKV
ncbi:MAG: hypothetical protein V1493_02215 [Candidatus Diapherotrites archaeon]